MFDTSLFALKLFGCDLSSMVQHLPDSTTLLHFQERIEEHSLVFSFLNAFQTF